MTAEAVLRIDFHGFWHCGTGRGASAAIDAVVTRDHLGLPYVPGRTIRGVLRDAVRQFEASGRFSGFERALFGSQGYVPTAGREEPTHEPGTDPGRLTITSATMEPAIVDWFEAHRRAGTLHGGQAEAARATLFQTLAMTAIDETTGTAADKTLRTVEVVVPLTLRASVGLRAAHPGVAASPAIDTEWTDAVRQACVLVGALGAGRKRGLGRCLITLETAGA